MAKKFRVEITAVAEADIRLAHAYIGQRNVPAADRWVARVEEKINRLERMPRAGEVIPEAQELGLEISSQVVRQVPDHLSHRRGSGDRAAGLSLSPIAGLVNAPAVTHCTNELTAAEKQAVLEYLKTL